MGILRIVAGLAFAGIVSACSVVPSASPPPPANLNAWQILERVEQSEIAYGSAHAVGWLKVRDGGPGRRVVASVSVGFHDDTTFADPLRWRIQEQIKTSVLGARSRVTMKNFRLGPRLALKLPRVPGWICLRLTHLSSAQMHIKQVTMRPDHLTRVSKAWIVPTKRRHAAAVDVDTLVKQKSRRGSSHTLIQYVIAKSNFVIQQMKEVSRSHGRGHWTSVTTYMTFTKYGEAVPAWLPMCHSGKG